MKEHSVRLLVITECFENGLANPNLWLGGNRLVAQVEAENV
jgi:hypothetical protein